MTVCTKRARVGSAAHHCLKLANKRVTRTEMKRRLCDHTSKNRSIEVLRVMEENGWLECRYELTDKGRAALADVEERSEEA